MPSRGSSTCTYSRSEESALYVASERLIFAEMLAEKLNNAFVHSSLVDTLSCLDLRS